MELLTISEISKNYNVSTRTLRYYEKMGLLESKRKDDYAYRVFDDTAIRRLEQIIILRKLRIPLKKILNILSNKDVKETVEIFQENINEFNSEINSLTIIRDVLLRLINEINEINKSKLTLDIFNEDELLKVVTTLAPSKLNTKEIQLMDDLKNANDVLANLKDVRVVYLPPATVASSHFIGENPEDNAKEKLSEFIKKNNLIKIKPDFRIYGFDNPCPKYDGEIYGYEFWVTIPDDMEVPIGLDKKHFEGGLYFAHCIKMGDFHEWKDFYNYAMKNNDYEIEVREPLGMGGSMEEELNVFSYYQPDNRVSMIKQLDLLIPIKQNH